MREFDGPAIKDDSGPKLFRKALLKHEKILMVLCTIKKVVYGNHKK